MQRRFPLLKEYAQIKQNMDLRDQLDAEMGRQPQAHPLLIADAANPGTVGDRRSEGLSRYPIPHTSGDETNESGIPQDKINSPDRDGQNTKDGQLTMREDSQDAKAMYD